jgi:hypothetical protein
MTDDPNDPTAQLRQIKGMLWVIIGMLVMLAFLLH